MRPIGLSARLKTATTTTTTTNTTAASQNVCWQCSLRIFSSSLSYRTSPLPFAVKAARNFSRTCLPRATVVIPPARFINADYFSSNTIATSKPAAASPSSGALPAQQKRLELLPHRRKQAARRQAAAAAAAAETVKADQQDTLPQNASDILTNVAASQPAHSLRRQLSAFLSLSKPRLTVLVVLTAMSPYALYPVPTFLTPLAETPSLSPLTLLFLTTGTTLCSASANALNMLYEPATDAQMSRTRNRPLVRQLLSTRAAVLFAVGCGLVGTAALYWGVNPTVAFLGAANIALYAGVYTPLKRLSCLNTWVGALVGGIPPLMGWAAAAGESATGDGTFRELLFASDGSSLGGWLLGGLLLAWQFPHFMALSWTIREEYKKAGLRMLCWVNPARNARVALRYSLVFVPICVGLCAVGVTEWTYAVTSLPANLWLAREAWRFYRHEGQKGSARGLFWASVWHLPVVMGLALLQKKGLWQRVWKSVVGEPEDEDEWEILEDEDEVGVAAVPLPRSTPRAL